MQEPRLGVETGAVLEWQGRLGGPVPECVVGEESATESGHGAEIDSYRGGPDSGGLERDDAAAAEHVQDHRRRTRMVPVDDLGETVECSALPMDRVIDVAAQRVVAGKQGGQDGGPRLC